MGLPVTLPTPPTAIQQAGSNAQQRHDGTLRFMMAGLTATLNDITSAGPAAFWAAQGTNGAALLAKFGAFVTFLVTNAPDADPSNPITVPTAITGATANLTANQDGSVTYTAPKA